MTTSISISSVADRNRCYPGEEIRFWVRVTVDKMVKSYKLLITIPVGVQVTRVLPAPIDDSNTKKSDKTDVKEPTSITWLQTENLPQHSTYEYEVTARVLFFDILWNHQKQQEEMRKEEEKNKGNEPSIWHTPDAEPKSITLYCRTFLYAPLTSDTNPIAQEIVPVVVFSKGRYMQYLPAYYEQQDDFLARFLMLFESFWAPISQQIEHIDNYFDLGVTPPDFLKWLATWFDLELSSQWGEQQKRAVVAEIVQLYRRRGTRGGLQRYLQLMTGSREVTITEYIAEQFRIGATARLGAGIAVGGTGAPHTFDVRIRLPKSEHYIQLAKADQVRLEQQDRKVLETIIDAEKPAHTAYTLFLEYADTVDRTDFAKFNKGSQLGIT